MKRRIKKGLSLLLAGIMAFSQCVSLFGSQSQIISYAATKAVVNTNLLNIRKGPGTEFDMVGKMNQGTEVSILLNSTSRDGKPWYKIEGIGINGFVSGYVSADYINLKPLDTPNTDFESYLNLEGFPESYKSSLKTLHDKYPNWIFHAQKTGLDWNDVIQNESVVGKNLVSASSISSWKSTDSSAYNWETGTWVGLDGANWVAASKEIIEYYMDPRNFLSEEYIFQFLTHEYDESLQNKEALGNILEGTFLANPVKTDVAEYQIIETPMEPDADTETDAISPSMNSEKIDHQVNVTIIGGDSEVITNTVTDTITDANMIAAIYSENESSEKLGPAMEVTNTYADTSTDYSEIIMAAAKQSRVSPYVLAAMIIQEQGTKGTSQLINGQSSNYPGFYNYFNVEAYQTATMNAVTRGLWYASQSGNYGRPWNTVNKSIIGGAVFYGDNYVHQGQDTYYLKKFNVQGDRLYKHQYMGNVQGAASEGLKLAKAYDEKAKQSALEFKIPVFNNMPAEACVKPTGNDIPNMKMNGIWIDGYNLSPAFDADTYHYIVTIDPNVETITVNASYGSTTKSANIRLNDEINEITISMSQDDGNLKNYTISIKKSASSGSEIIGSIPTTIIQ